MRTLGLTIFAALLSVCSDAQAYPPFYVPNAVVVEGQYGAATNETMTYFWNDATSRLEAANWEGLYTIRPSDSGQPKLFGPYEDDLGAFDQGFVPGSANGSQTIPSDNAFIIRSVDFGYGYDPHRILYATSAGAVMAFVFFVFTDVLRFFWQSTAGRASHIVDA